VDCRGPGNFQDSSEGPHALLEIWDIERTALVETYYTRAVSNISEAFEEPKQIAAEDAETTPAAAIAALVRSHQDSGGSLEAFARRARSSIHGLSREDLPSPPSADIRSMVIGFEFGGNNVVHRSSMADPPGDGKSTSRSATGRGFLLCSSEDRKIRTGTLAAWSALKRSGMARVTAVTGSNYDVLNGPSEHPQYNNTGFYVR